MERVKSLETGRVERFSTRTDRWLTAGSSREFPDACIFSHLMQYSTIFSDGRIIAKYWAVQRPLRDDVL